MAAVVSVYLVVLAIVIAQVTIAEFVANAHYETPGLSQSDEFFDNNIFKRFESDKTNDGLIKYILNETIPTEGSLMNMHSASEKNVEQGEKCEEACTPVEITRTLDVNHLKPAPNVVFLPGCFKIKTCSGCCIGKNKICTASKISTTPRIISVMRLANYKGRRLITFHDTTVYQHLECECMCATSSSDCSSQQTFLEADCSCRCRATPRNCGVGYKWNNELCRCECGVKPSDCREIRKMFNSTTCSCELSRFSGKYSSASGSFSYMPGTRSSIINSLQYEDTLETAEKTMALYNIEKPEVHIDYDDLMKIEKKPICMPKVIDLPLPIDQYDNAHYFPNVVEVNQCSGSCVGKYSKCTPTLTETVEKTVLQMNSRNKTVRVVRFNFTQHLQCGCTCHLTPENCNPLFGHSEPRNCECLCRRTVAGPFDRNCVERDGKEFRPPSAYELVYTTYHNVTGRLRYPRHFAYPVDDLTTCGLMCRSRTLALCRAYEYSVGLRECWVYDERETAVDRLYRNRNLDATYVKREARCRPQHTPMLYAHASKRTHGGVRRVGVSTLAECKKACRDIAACLGIDFADDKRCYLNYLPRRLVDNSSINHYRIFDRCVEP